MPDLSLLSPLVGAVLGSLVGQAVARRFARLRETASPGGGRRSSLECGVGLARGQHPLLRRRPRLARCVVRHGTLELEVFRWGVRVWRHPAFALDVASVDRGSVRRAVWWARVNAATSVRTVTVTTREGVQVDLVLPVEELDTVLDVLEGLPPRTPSQSGGEGGEGGEGADLPELPRGWVWSTERTVRVTSRAPGSGDVAGQLLRALDDVEQQLAQQQVPLSGLEHLQVRTTDAHAVGARVAALAERLRARGATPSIYVLAVDRLPAPGQAVELDATAHCT